VKYRSWLLRTLDTVVFSPFYLLGIMEQTQMRLVSLFKNYQENAFKSTSKIVLVIDNPAIELYEAALLIQVHFTGLKYFMFYWPLTSAIFGIGTLVMVIMVLALSSWYTVREASNSHHYQSVLKGSVPINEIGTSEKSDKTTTQPGDHHKHSD